MKNNRKKKLINFSYQLKTAIPAVLISIISFSIIIGFIIYITSMSNLGIIGTTSSELDRAIENEDNIVSSFKAYAQKVKDPIFILATEKITEDHNKSINVIKDRLNILKVYSEKNSQLLWIAIVMMIVNAILLFRYLIHSTHKAAGPIHVMNRYVRDILEGRKPEIRSLRKNDELKDFYEDFTRLVEKYKRKHVKEDKTQLHPDHVVDEEEKDNIALLRINKHE
jgi:hypothetical protein